LKTQNQTENKTIGVSYVVGYYIEVEQLTTLLAQYINYFLELEQKYGVEGIGKIDEAEKDLLNNLLQSIRHLVIKTKMKTNVIYRSINKSKLDHPDIKKLSDHIISTFIIDRKILNEYVMELNLFVTQDVIQSLIVNNQEIVSQIYNQNSNQQNG
jgi:hypothetical protein